MRRPSRPLSTVAVLAALVVVAACTSTPAAPPAPTVTRAQVGWMNTVCGQLTTLGGITPPAPSPSYPGEDRDFSSSSFVSSTASSVTTSVQALSTLPPLGSPAADGFAAERVRKLGEITQQLDRIQNDEGSGFDRTAAQSRAAAKKVSDLVRSATPSGPDLPTVASGDPALALAYDLAPACDPVARQRVTAPPASPSPVPAAAVLPVPKDGTNLAACADGSCEVLLDKPTAVTVSGIEFTVNTDVLPVTATTRFPGGGSGQVALSVGGGGSFGTAGGRTVTVTLAGAAGGAAVLRFASK
jgi:hypothetical protein